MKYLKSAQQCSSKELTWADGTARAANPQVSSQRSGRPEGNPWQTSQTNQPARLPNPREPQPVTSSQGNTSNNQLTRSDLRLLGQEASLSFLLSDTQHEIPCAQQQQRGNGGPSTPDQRSTNLVDRATSPGIKIMTPRHRPAPNTPQSQSSESECRLHFTPRDSRSASGDGLPGGAARRDDVTAAPPINDVGQTENADAADGFTLVQRRNRRNSAASQQQPETDTMLQGRKVEPAEDMYLRNIERKRGESLKNVADRVRSFCAKKNLRIMATRVYANKFCDDVVGCRLTVPIRQTDEMLGNRMWPDEMICRRWRKSNNQGRRDNANQRNDNVGRQEYSRQDSNSGYTRYPDYNDWDRRTSRYDRDEQYNNRYEQDYDDQGRDSGDRRSQGSLNWRNDRHSRTQNEYRGDDGRGY